MIDAVAERFKAWYAQPLKFNGDALDVWLAFGAALLFMAVWRSLFKSFDAL